MTNSSLSPAAQAVFNAAWTCPIVLGDHPATRSRQIAAALRAAATILREAYTNEEYVDPADDWLLAIAAELETSTTENS